MMAALWVVGGRGWASKIRISLLLEGESKLQINTEYTVNA